MPLILPGPRARVNPKSLIFCGIEGAGEASGVSAPARAEESGRTHNAMAAWKATEEDARKWAHVALANRHVSHAYYRPGKSVDWPYELYTTIRGRNPEVIQQVIMELMAEWAFREYPA